MMPGFALVDDDDVSGWIAHHGHVADGCFKRFHFEPNTGGFEGRDAGFKVHGFKAAARAISTG